MHKKSHIDTAKLDEVPMGDSFEYKDVVEDDFPLKDRPEDGLFFKAEVDRGMYESIVLKKDTGNRVLYEKK
ncbi:hypothetical protein [Clostridium grantii]|uniref:Uncharacterized protein n=1 Tax=Clostridium grantii DSM 8605 TaxID=1121316 RepID=A0A1M5V5X2_9CLOT|nr:hypothetical protein [Clostridium grantii]SHH70586.1 hypothetical protein SAMN02745207_02104 [Clostridium grantii DSM 8605]